MSKSNTFENDLLLLLFNNTNIANFGDATGLRGSSAPGNLYLALHTASPGEGGDQTTNEIAYTGYERVAVARSGAEFSVSGNQVSLVNNHDFPLGTGGSGTATHWSVGTAASGAGRVLYSAALSQNIVCGAGVTPRVNAGAMATED